jgi:hypothetical protein
MQAELTAIYSAKVGILAERWNDLADHPKYLRYRFFVLLLRALQGNF